MNINWTEVRDEISNRCMEQKDSQQAAIELAQRYKGLSEEQRLAANKEMELWLIDPDPSLRFDAAYVVSVCSVQALLPAMERAISKLSAYESPQSYYEIKKLKKIIDSMIY